jgi:uncharacterized coiled-coil protein SlyX
LAPLPSGEKASLLAVSIFLFRQHDDGDTHGRLAQLEEAVRSQGRELEELRAQMTESVALLTVLLAPTWLRDLIERAKASGGRVDCSPKGVVFTWPEGEEHTRTVPVPIPGDSEEQIRSDLLTRVACFERRAA